MSIKLLQEKIGVAADGNFGPQTLSAAAKYFNLTDAKAAHFFGQCHHESGGFKRFVENLNYSSASRIRAVWPSRFPTDESAAPYVRNPEALANKVYGGRMGNTEPGDGWNFRGHGPIQLTGRGMFEAFSESDPKYHLALSMPELVATDYAFDSAYWYFDMKKLWPIAKNVNEGTMMTITRAINGGLHGFADRKAQTMKFYGWLK